MPNKFIGTVIIKTFLLNEFKTGPHLKKIYIVIYCLLNKNKNKMYRQECLFDGIDFHNLLVWCMDHQLQEYACYFHLVIWRKDHQLQDQLFCCLVKFNQMYIFKLEKI